MPVLFIGHGSPDNAFEDNDFTREWRRLAITLPKPKAILAISAHWVTEGATLVTGMAQPETIHDFYGFPESYSAFRYPAPGAPEFAARIRERITTVPVRLDDSWGLDHGTWSILTHLYPQADVPVIQMSIDSRLSAQEHWLLGQEISVLRDEGVLILGSGNIVHHLGMIRWGGEPYEWATEFDATVRQTLRHQDAPALIRYPELKHASLAIPTSEHYLPLLYIIGASRGETPQFFNESIFASSISMTGVVFG
ncbi:MAG: 4,5-DOPA dioxygenase extradiol [Candidatus Moranbacteria bacterium]|nr:4,5-DOPA dioxygenase extradiol [Candidatus Moranbacteria bacterium]